MTHVFRSRYGALLAGVLGALAAVFVAGGTGAAAQSDDLRAAIDFVLAVHPDPYRYVAAEELSGALAEEVARLESIDRPTDLDLGLSLHRLLARLGDAHLAVALPSLQPGASGSELLLPLLPKRIGGAVYVDASEPSFPPGTELLAIGGVSIGDLYDAMADLVLIDGDRPEVRRARLDRDFSLPFHLLRGMRADYDIRVRLPDGQERTERLPAADRETIAALHARRLSGPSRGVAATTRPPWPFLYEADGVHVLRLAAFGVGDQDGYRARVDEIFAGLRGDETLVIDLRGNIGGLRTNGIAVLQHLLGEPYTQWSRIATRVREIPEPFLPRVAFPFAPPEALSGFPGEPRDGSFVFEGDPLAERMSGADEPHRGEVFVFVDDATNSAAIETLAALLAHRPDVRILGRETGGECGRHIGEFPVMYSTSTDDSALRLLVSLAAIEHVPVPGCQPGRGFVPDRVVDDTVEDFLEGSDPYLKALRQLLAGRS